VGGIVAWREFAVIREHPPQNVSFVTLLNIVNCII